MNHNSRFHRTSTYTIALLLGFAVFAVSSVASAKTFANKSAKVTFTSPAGWEAEQDKEDDWFIEMESPDGSSLLIVELMESKTKAKALEEAEELVDDEIDNPKDASNVKDVTINGLKATHAETSGKYEGKTVQIKVHVVQTPSGKFIFIARAAPKDKVAAADKALKSLLDSFKGTK